MLHLSKNVRGSKRVETLLCQKGSTIKFVHQSIITNNHNFIVVVTVSREKIIRIIIFSHFHYHILHICTFTSPFLIYKNGIMHAERQGKGSSFTLMWLVRWKEAITLIKTEKTPCWHLQSHTHLLSPPSIWLLYLVLINLSLFLSALSLSISLSLPDHFTLLSISPLPTGPHLCLVFSLQPFLFSHHLLPSTFMTLWVIFFLLSSILLHFFRPLPFSCGWWGPEKAGSVSSHDPMQPPLNPARRTPQSPSSPVNKMMKAQQIGIRSNIMRLSSDRDERDRGFLKIKKKARWRYLPCV